MEKKLFTFTMFNEKKDLIVVYMLYNRCVLCFKFYMQIEMEQKSPLFPVFCILFFSYQATIRHAFLENIQQPCTQIHETNLELKFLCK